MRRSGINKDISGQRICGKGSKSSKIRIANVSKMIFNFFLQKKSKKKSINQKVGFSNSKCKLETWPTEFRPGTP